MNELLHVNGITRIFDEESESYIYYTKTMLSNNLLIEDFTTEQNGELQSIITLKHYNDLDAIQLQIHWGDYLEQIRVYRIVKDIIEILENHSLSEFLEIMKDFSVSYMNAASQSVEKNKIEIREDIINSFEIVKFY